MKTIVEIEWDEPQEQSWLCAYNIEIALHAYCTNTKFKVRDFVQARSNLIEALEVALDALRFLSCDGMDDGDFYDEEGIVEGTIMMANTARTALEKIKELK